MTYKLRQMTIRDYEAVIALWRGTPGMGLDDYNDSRLGIRRFNQRNPGLSCVAVEQGSVVGAVLCGHDGRRGYLHHLAVAASHRRLGIAKAIILRCLRLLGKRHIPKCNIFLFRNNSKGRAFWTHNGWNPRPDLCLLQKKTKDL